MSDLSAKMRWYPGDALIPIKQDRLDQIGKRHGAQLSVTEIVGQDQQVLPGGVVAEWNWEKSIDDSTQTIVAIETDKEDSFRKCVREVIDTYRGPVPIWGLWGSTRRAENIINQLLDESDGWT